MNPHSKALQSRRTVVLLTTFLFMMVVCVSVRAAGKQPTCDPDNGSIDLPDGFCALVFADNLGAARHLTVRDNGYVYVRLGKGNGEQEGTVVALQDSNGDGRADRVERFAEDGGTGIAIHDRFLYYSTDTAIRRYPLRHQQLLPAQRPQTIVKDLLARGQHAAKTFTFDDAGNLYVNVGAPSNACQKQSRTLGSPGLDPCPQLEDSGGVWRFAADRLGQQQNGSEARFASGIRHALALDWNSAVKQLYVVQHGRDQLSALWPEFYSDEDSAELPAEELLVLNEDDTFGWPYCYYNQRQKRLVLAPEYGGDGKKTQRCEKLKPPALAFPGHWAPNDLVFYSGEQFPKRYQGAAFIAFHGSWNRAPLPQAGYKVVAVPFSDNKPTVWEEFAGGFAGKDNLQTLGEARFRPAGVAQGPDGSLYIADSVKGRIWRVIYTGETPAEPQ